MGTTYDSGIRPIVDHWLLKKAQELRDYGDYWSASSAGYCMRKVIFERLKVPYVTQDARKQRVFSSGHIFHEWLQAITKEAGISIAQEVELQDEELMIRGHFDDLVLANKPIEIGNVVLVEGKISQEKINEAVIKAQQHLILYDYKTAHSKWFEYRRTNGISHYHKMQLGTYMYMLRKGYKERNDQWKEYSVPHEINEARILHISKDDLRMAETILFWTPELEKEVYSYWSTLNGYWKSQKIPKCTCADYEGGFMAKEKWNPFYYNGQPCSLDWYHLSKGQKEQQVTA